MSPPSAAAGVPACEGKGIQPVFASIGFSSGSAKMYGQFIAKADLPDVHAASEIDLRGMRVDEAESAVMQALDAAVRADLRSLRIIHGKGTGALRERVTEMLTKDTRVKQFRMGAWNEGGAGVTVAEL